MAVGVVEPPSVPEGDGIGVSISVLASGDDAGKSVVLILSEIPGVRGKGFAEEGPKTEQAGLSKRSMPVVMIVDILRILILASFKYLIQKRRMVSIIFPIIAFLCLSL